MKIPAIKGKIGETIYYIANLTFQRKQSKNGY